MVATPEITIAIPPARLAIYQCSSVSVHQLSRMPTKELGFVLGMILPMMMNIKPTTDAMIGKMMFSTFVIVPGCFITIRIITFFKIIKLKNSFQRKFYGIFMEWIDHNTIKLIFFSFRKEHSKVFC